LTAISVSVQSLLKEGYQAFVLLLMLTEFTGEGYVDIFVYGSCVWTARTEIEEYSIGFPTIATQAVQYSASYISNLKI